MDMSKKDPTFKCPSCGEMLSVESAGDSNADHEQMNDKKNKVVKQPNAATMPMNNLKNKISQVPGMPQNPSVPPNLNSY
jgi:hypothetical protein